MKYIKKILISLLLIILILNLPEIHRNYIRESVGNTVVMILNKAGTSGGTGSHVTAPSGQTYIITNSHICASGLTDGFVMVFDNFGNILQRRILLDSDVTDLCIVEGMPGQPGLSLGSTPKKGEIIHFIGHPKLMPTTMTSGEIIGKKLVEAEDHIIKSPDDKCDLPKNIIEKGIETTMKDGIEVNLPVLVCCDKIKSMVTTATALHGSSGSPVVNSYGNLVGVVFAITENNWGMFIPLEDIINILKPF